MGHAIFLGHHAGAVGVTNLAGFHDLADRAPVRTLVTGGRISSLMVSRCTTTRDACCMNGLVKRGFGVLLPPGFKKR
jgi:hypothetical protein